MMGTFMGRAVVKSFDPMLLARLQRTANAAPFAGRGAGTMLLDNFSAAWLGPGRGHDLRIYFADAEAGDGAAAADWSALPAMDFGPDDRVDPVAEAIRVVGAERLDRIRERTAEFFDAKLAAWAGKMIWETSAPVFNADGELEVRAVCTPLRGVVLENLRPQPPELAAGFRESRDNPATPARPYPEAEDLVRDLASAGVAGFVGGGFSIGVRPIWTDRGPDIARRPEGTYPVVTMSVVFTLRR